MTQLLLAPNSSLPSRQTPPPLGKNPIFPEGRGVCTKGKWEIDPTTGGVCFFYYFRISMWVFLRCPFQLIWKDEEVNAYGLVSPLNDAIIWDI